MADSFQAKEIKLVDGTIFRGRPIYTWTLNDSGEKVLQVLNHVTNQENKLIKYGYEIMPDKLLYIMSELQEKNDSEQEQQ